MASAPVTFSAAGAILVASVASMVSEGALKRLAMLPGNTVLGERHIWNIVTAALVETDAIRLAVQLALVLVAGLRAEQLALPSTTRVGWALLAALLVSGTVVSFGSLMMYLSTTDEAYLYKPLWGTGPVVVALSVAAHQVLGDTPIFPTHAPGLTFSLLPLVAVVVAAVSQFGVLSSRDFIATCVSLGAAWVYLRWIHTYAPGVVGDTRDEFDFLSMVPNPVRVALRPFVKLLGAILLRLPLFVGASGDGMKALPPPLSAAGIGGAYAAGSEAGKAGSAGAAASAPDPVAERRRERALKALDKKLAELRSSIRAPAGGSAGVPAGGSSSPGGGQAAGAGALGSSLSTGDVAGPVSHDDLSLGSGRSPGVEGGASTV